MLAGTSWCHDRHHEGTDRLDPAVARGRAADTGQDTGRHAGLRRLTGFNTVNQLRILGRWMRCLTIPNQSSIPKPFQQFDDAGRMLPSSFYNRVVDVMEELAKFTYLTRGRA